MSRSNVLQPTITAMPTHDEIARRAFDIYVSTGRRQGQCEQNWQQAEQDLRNEDMAACHSAQCSDESPDGLNRHQRRHQHRDRRQIRNQEAAKATLVDTASWDNAD